MTPVKFPLKYNGGTIYDRKDGGGYRAVLHVGGAQLTKTSQQLNLLKTWIDRNSGIIREGKIPLTNTENVEYRKALAALPTGVSLLEAVQSYRQHMDKMEALKRGIKFRDGVDLYLSECKTKGVKEATLYNYEKYLRRVGKAWDNLSLPGITTEDVRELLALDGLFKDTTRHQNHNLLTIFFNFAKKQKWISDNPVGPVARAKIKPKRPEVFTVEEAKRIMYTAQQKYPKAVIYFALCLFAGIRPETVERLSWEHIGDEKVLIPMELSKTPHDYETPIRPNLRAWLDLIPPEHRKGELYPVSTNTLRGGLFKKVRDESVERWKSHGARHTFASCVCALEGAEKAVEQLGHQSPSMLYRHYRTLIAKEDAKALFEIYPE